MVLVRIFLRGASWVGKLGTVLSCPSMALTVSKIDCQGRGFFLRRSQDNIRIFHELTRISWGQSPPDSI